MRAGGIIEGNKQAHQELATMASICIRNRSGAAVWAEVLNSKQLRVDGFCGFDETRWWSR